MKEISNHFCIIPQGAIEEQLLRGEPVVKSPAMDEYIATGKVSINQESRLGDNGLSWTVSFRAAIMRSVAIKYNGRRQYVGIVLTDGTLAVIGTVDKAPVLVVTPGERECIVEASIEMPEPLDLM